jgi:glycosyltransferase involved in cell wall biosynthesis/SAM-dependent methyltransferase
VHACTIVARNYLAHARVLAASFLEHHPEGNVDVLLLDDIDYEGQREAEVFSFTSPYEIGLERAEFHRMAMMYTTLELATAVKPWYLKTLLERSDGEVLYLDPDMLVFGSLPDVFDSVRESSIALTPHLLQPLDPDGREPDETTILNAGIFNLGFIGVSKDAGEFLEWWSRRLRRECIVDIQNARFVDQRWVDLAAGMFNPSILRDPGLNVAHWNLPQRHVSYRDDTWYANGVPLRLYHFSGFDPDRPDVLSKHQGLDPRIAPSATKALTRLYDEYGARLQRAGYARVRSLPFRFEQFSDGTTITPAARRTYRSRVVRLEQDSVSAPDPFFPRAEPREGVNIVGYLQAELGVGEAARQLSRAIRAAKIRTSSIAVTSTQNRQDHAFEVGADVLYDVNLLCINADQLPTVASTLGDELFEGRYSIGVWFWEVDVFPPAMLAAAAYVDEVWVASEHIARALRAAVAVPVTTYPVSIEPPAPLAFERADLGLPQDRTLFLFSFDFASTLERKNPLGLIEAYRKAFGQEDGAHLIVKSINGHLYADALSRVVHAAEGRHDITVVDEYYSAEQKAALVGLCDCYVSLHRSEGLGLGMLEAMAQGRPVIGTGYSGNLEFMSSENSYLVPYELVHVPPGCDPYPVDASWAEPDLDVAAAMMRDVLRDPGRAAVVGARAKSDVARLHSPARAGAAVADRLARIRISEWWNDPGSVSSRRASEIARSMSGDEDISSTSVLAPPAPWAWLFPPSRLWPLRGLRRVLNRVLSPYTSAQYHFGRSVSRMLARLERRDDDLAGSLVEMQSRLDRHAARVSPSTIFALEGRDADLAGAIEATRRDQERGFSAVDGALHEPPHMADRTVLETTDDSGRKAIGFRGGMKHADGVYASFEDVFRGSEEFIRDRQRAYVERLRVCAPVLDVGCGRGEMLDLLRDNDIAASGVDLDEGMVERCIRKGHDVRHADALHYLAERGPGAFGAIFAAQFIEHLDYAQLTEFLRLARSSLVPGGRLIVETVNPHSISALRTFWVDPTHRAPLFPEVVVTLCGLHGFVDAFVVFPHGSGDLEDDRRSQGEYAVIARCA